MYSRHHAIGSLVVGTSFVLVTETAIVLIAYAVLLGTLIDLDHFPIARYNQGSWDALRFCLNNPVHAVVDQSDIFSIEAVYPLQRLLSHVLLGGTLCLALLVVDTTLAILSAVVLYFHILMDLIADLRHGRDPIQQSAGDDATR